MTVLREVTEILLAAVIVVFLVNVLLFGIDLALGNVVDLGRVVIGIIL